MLALETGEKSPPGLFQLSLLKKRWTQVASPEAEEVPVPSLPEALEVPSPQSARSLCTLMVSGPALVRDIRRVRVTSWIVEPAGT